MTKKEPTAFPSFKAFIDSLDIDPDMILRRQPVLGQPR